MEMRKGRILGVLEGKTSSVLPGHCSHLADPVL